MKWSISIIALLLLWSCGNNQEQNAQGKWIKRTEQEKLETIENQFKGFDMTMVETGYRYQELYWAGQDENWEYADYQIEKNRKTIENGLERRPKRAKFAEHFLTMAPPEMEKALEEKDTILFNKNFKILTNSCIGSTLWEKYNFLL